LLILGHASRVRYFRYFIGKGTKKELEKVRKGEKR